MKKTDPRIILFLGVLMTSFSSIIARYSDAPSLVIVTIRLLWTVGLMLPVVLFRRKEELKKVSRRDLLICAAAGTILALHFYAWFESLKWTSIATSTVLVRTEVIFSAMGFIIFLKGKIPRMEMLGIFISMGGSALLAFSEGSVGGGSLKGGFLALAAAVLLALYTLISRVQRSHLSTTVFTFLAYIACLSTLLILDVVTATPLTGWGMSTLLVGLLLTVCCTYLGHSLFSWSLKWITPSYVSAVKLCGPICAATLAFILFGETLRPLQVAAGLVILAGALLCTVAEGKIWACNLKSADV
ncbi:MAG: DMT family transporter [Clostridia bacterium]|nr:DMT family transporter [Clostridia bacterium]